jgi:hypothetical protein
MEFGEAGVMVDATALIRPPVDTPIRVIFTPQYQRRP